MDEELEKLKKEKLKKLKQQQGLQESMGEQREKQKEELEQKKKQIIRSVLTSSARERLGRIKLARPKVAESIEKQLIILAQRGRLENKINDKQLRNLLSKMTRNKRDINIKRK